MTAEQAHAVAICPTTLRNAAYDARRILRAKWPEQITKHIQRKSTPEYMSIVRSLVDILPTAPGNCTAARDAAAIAIYLEHHPS